MNTWTGKLLGWLSLAAILSFNAVATTFYVDVNSTNPVLPYTDWSTAATNIQDAIDAATDGDLVLVTNGVYATGGQTFGSPLTNRVVLNKPINVRSVNGPAATTIVGYQVPGTTNGDAAVRCVYMTDGALLAGFTVTNGATQANSRGDTDGAGIYCATVNAMVSNCVLVANSSGYGYGGGVEGCTLYNCQLVENRSLNRGGGASYSVLVGCNFTNNHVLYLGGGGAYFCSLSNCVFVGNTVDAIDWQGQGGGADNSHLANCTFIGNFAYFGGGSSASEIDSCLISSNTAVYGGGAVDSTLNNCTVTGNFASFGGGTESCAMNNSLLYQNYGTNGVNYNHRSIYSSPDFFNHCCTWPLPTNGVGNITNAPIFVYSDGGDFHLQSTSPCINAGINSLTSVTNDLDGNPRIVGGTVDIGAYEYQTPASTLSYAWAQQYGLPTDGTADSADTDGDGLNNWQEWKAGTVPTNAASVLQLASPTNSVSGLVVTWRSVANITYYLQRSSDLGGGFSSLVSNLVGQAGSTSCTDTTATNAGPYFYRVGVQ
ncbi:MAG TPA: choice-of-anchor Q domain-containing protein [bacterium]|jgi:hypothetical protein|nr:choice-of-anchor Q domain-containing protein [bacterium]